jgi:two-component system response regulator FixJ
MVPVHLFSENVTAIRTISVSLRGVGAVQRHRNGGRVAPEALRAGGCVVVDMDEPIGWWRATLAEAVAEPHLPIVLVTSRPVARDIVLAVRLGAYDVLDWVADGPQLRATVGALGADGGDAARAGGSRLDRLTARQRQILALASTGMASKEIARALSLSTRTVEAHRMRMVKRLTARSFLELVREQVRGGG